jgi:hypothetical protein
MCVFYVFRSWIKTLQSRRLVGQTRLLFSCWVSITSSALFALVRSASIALIFVLCATSCVAHVTFRAISACSIGQLMRVGVPRARFIYLQSHHSRRQPCQTLKSLLHGDAKSKICCTMSRQKHRPPKPSARFFCTLYFLKLQRRAHS